MPLRKASDGRIVLVKDWDKDRIGKACLQAQPLPGEGMAWLQATLVPAKFIRVPVKTSRRVRPDPQIEKLSALFKGI